MVFVVGYFCWLLLVVVVGWFGCWLLVVGWLVGCCLFVCCLLVVGCWLLVVGCWLLVVGCWLLVVGCWLLVVGCWFFGFWLFFFCRQSPQDDTVTRRVTQVTVCAKLTPRKLRLPASEEGASHTCHTSSCVQCRIPQHPSNAAPRSLDRVCFRHFPQRKRNRSWSLAHSISLIDGLSLLPKVHAYWDERRISWPGCSAIWFLACDESLQLINAPTWLLCALLCQQSRRRRCPCSAFTAERDVPH